MLYLPSSLLVPLALDARLRARTARLHPDLPTGVIDQTIARRAEPNRRTRRPRTCGVHELLTGGVPSGTAAPT